MDYKSNQGIIDIISVIDRDINSIALENFVLEGNPYHFTDLMGFMAAAVLQKSCGKEWDIALTRKNNTEAAGTWVNKIYVTAEELELLILKVYEDYYLKGKIEVAYYVPGVYIQTFQLFIAMVLAVAYYDKKGQFPDIVDTTFYYEKLRPAPDPEPAPAPATETRDLAYWQAQIDAIGYIYARYAYSLSVSDQKTMERVGYGDCWAMSDGICKSLGGRQVKARVVQYATSMSPRHRTVQYLFNGQWYNFDYSKYGFDYRFKYTSGVNSGTVLYYNM